MKIKNLIITSPAVLDFELDVTAPVCVFHGEHSALALDLMRELIGDHGATTDPDAYDDGHFVIHSDIKMLNIKCVLHLNILFMTVSN